MEKLSELLRRNNGFLLPFVTLLLVSSVPLIMFPKGEEVIYVNQWHTPVADMFFRYCTHLGDGRFAVLLAAAMLWVRFRHALQILLAWGISGLAVQLLKNTVFAGLPRPAAYFGDAIPLHYVEGVTIHMSNSFPSGHSATAFAVFLSLSMMLQGRSIGLSFACFAAAVAVGFSRIYLVQHFGADVYAGACIGVLTAVYVGYQIEQPQRWFNRPFWQKNLRNFRRAP